MYTLYLTEEDWNDISFVGNRYEWSNALLRICQEGDNELSESEAWDLHESFAADADGGHSMFPMLAYNSLLWRKLNVFMMAIV